MMSMKMHTSLPLILLLGASMLPERANAHTDQKHQIPNRSSIVIFLPNLGLVFFLRIQ
jgi:hypothetical protein